MEQGGWWSVRVDVVGRCAGLLTGDGIDTFGPNIDIPSEETNTFPDLESDVKWERGEQSEG
jgi:hypothetical protein